MTTEFSTSDSARPTRPVALVQHDPVGDLSISIEGVGTAVAATYADLPKAVETLRTRIAASYDHDTVTIIFPAGDDPIGRHGRQRYVTASHWPTPSGYDAPNPDDPWDTEHGRDVLITTHDDGQVGVHVVRRFGDGAGHQVLRVEPDQGGWIARYLGRHPEAHVELTKTGLRMVDSADWRAAILGRVARAWDAHPDARLGQVLVGALEFAVDDPQQHAAHDHEDFWSLLHDVQDDDLGAALDGYVSVDDTET